MVTLTRGAPAKTVINVDSTEISVLCETPFGHKIAVMDIEKGEAIIKYGVKIGVATIDIQIGEHVHIHNVDEVSLTIRDEEKRRSLQG